MKIINKIKVGISASIFMLTVSLVASVNDSPAKKIKNILDLAKVTGVFGSPEAANIIHNLSRTVDTVGRSRDTIHDNVAITMFDDLIDPTVSLEVNNNSVAESFNSPDRLKKRKARVLNHAAKNMPINKRLKYSLPNIRHITTPELKVCRRTRKDKLVGGHWIRRYAPGQVSPQCFLGQDNHTLGVFAFGAHAKTVKNNFDSTVILNSLRGSQVVAQDDKFTITRTPADDGFLSSFYNEHHVLKADTTFPILVAQAHKKDAAGNIVLGSFGRLSADYNSITDKEVVVVNALNYNTMMNHGTPLRTAVGAPVMVDITKPFQTNYRRELIALGFHKNQLPGKLYGYGMA